MVYNLRPSALDDPKERVDQATFCASDLLDIGYLPASAFHALGFDLI